MMPFPPRTIIPLWSNSSGSRGIDWPEFQRLVAEASGVNNRLQQSRARFSALALVSGVPVNITVNPLELTTGYWRVSGAFGYVMPAATSITSLEAAFNIDSGLMPVQAQNIPLINDNVLRFRTMLFENSAGEVGYTSRAGMLPSVRVVITQPVINIFLLARAAFTVDALSVYGSIWAEYEGAIPV